MYKMIISALVVLASGCSLTPYKENFACEGTDNFGRCVSVQGAYQEATTGTVTGKKITRDGEDHEALSNEVFPNESQGVAISPEKKSYSRYKSALYQELNSMIVEPVTPMIKQARAVRTLVLPYPSRAAGKPLYMPRYVYFFADEPSWVIGQYLNKTKSHLQPLIKGN